jgi:hypothetical protein
VDNNPLVKKVLELLIRGRLLLSEDINGSGLTERNRSSYICP